MAAPNSDATVKIINIYTDGACSGNPGPGGWGTRIEFSDGQVQELGGAEASTTNNRMELQAAIAALDYAQDWEPIDTLTLHSDSQYVLKGITQWIKGWKRKGWKTAQGKPVLNKDLWQTLDQLNLPAVKWQHVKGHAGNPGNERCDTIATGFAAGRPPRLSQRTTQAASQADGRAAATEKNIPEKQESSKFVDNSSIGAAEHTKTQKSALALDDAASSVDILTENNMDQDRSNDLSGSLPREARVAQVRNMVETLNMADEIADKGFLISSSELADLMDVNASAVTSRGEQWVWRNWVVSRVRREGNQILWQLERVD